MPGHRSLMRRVALMPSMTGMFDHVEQQFARRGEKQDAFGLRHIPQLTPKTDLHRQIVRLPDIARQPPKRLGQVAGHRDGRRDPPRYAARGIDGLGQCRGEFAERDTMGLRG